MYWAACSLVQRQPVEASTAWVGPCEIHMEQTGRSKGREKRIQIKRVRVISLCVLTRYRMLLEPLLEPVHFQWLQVCPPDWPPHQPLDPIGVQLPTIVSYYFGSLGFSCMTSVVHSASSRS